MPSRTIEKLREERLHFYKEKAKAIASGLKMLIRIEDWDLNREAAMIGQHQAAQRDVISKVGTRYPMHWNGYR